MKLSRVICVFVSVTCSENKHRNQSTKDYVLNTGLEADFAYNPLALSKDERERLWE